MFAFEKVLVPSINRMSMYDVEFLHAKKELTANIREA
jgi:hypothetical protein